MEKSSHFTTTKMSNEGLYKDIKTQQRYNFRTSDMNLIYLT